MKILHQCPGCKLKSRVDPSFVGKLATCKKCGTKSLIKAEEIPEEESGAELVLDTEDETLPAPRKAQAPARPISQPKTLARETVDPGAQYYAQQGPSNTQVVVNVQSQRPEKGTSGLGIAALVIGILALLICWIPFVGMACIPISIIGIILSSIGFCISLFGKKSGVGMPISGGILCALAIVFSVGMTGGTVAAIGKGIEESEKTKRKLEKENQDRQIVSGPNIQNNGIPSGPKNVVLPNTPAPQKDDGKKWVPFGNAITLGDFQVKVDSAKIGKVESVSKITDSEYESTENQLMVFVSLKNIGTKKKITFKTWKGGDFSMDRNYASLEDENENIYKRIGFGSTRKIVGDFEDSSLYPGKSLTDVLVFEIPIDSAQSLRLELPAENFGEKGMLRFEIPRSVIQK